MPNYRLLPAAEASLVECFQTSLGNWGLSQAEDYKAGLLDLFRLLATQPEMGRLRPEIVPNLRSFPYQRHVVFYRNAGKAGIEIIDVLHGSMEAVRWLRSDTAEQEGRDEE